MDLTVFPPFFFSLSVAVVADLGKFLHWRVKLMEIGTQLLNMTTVNTMVQIHDYEGVSMFSSNDATKAAAKETVKIFGDHYPELLSRKFFINVPWVLSGFYTFMLPFIPARTAKKFVVCSSSYKEELLAVIPAENLPIKYGGLSRMGILLEMIPLKTTVASRTFFASEIKVEQAATVFWEFVLLADDIEFACNFVDAEGKLTNVETVKKVGANLTIGKFDAPSAGTLKLIWDNGYSIFTSKTVFHRHSVVPK